MYLIVGGDSTIGKALGNYWDRLGISYHASTRQRELVTETRPFIDLENIESYCPSHAYDGAVICAAMSRLSDCEQYPEKTYNINVKGTCKIAKKLNKAGVFVLFLSTSQVFGGSKPFRTPDETTHPINEYGKQKCETENCILQLNHAAILRLAKVIFNDFPLFVEWRKKLALGQKIQAYDNYFFAPVELSTVINIINRLLQNKASGIYHTPSSPDLTYYEYALSVAKSLNIDPSLVERTDGIFDFNYCKYTSLSTQKCIVCDGRLEYLESNYDFNLVTSDCRIWDKKVDLSYCNKCGLVQRPRTVTWTKECLKIYSTYEAYRQGTKEEQKTFDSRGYSESRSSKILKYFIDEFKIFNGNWLDYGCGDGSLLRMVSTIAPDFKLNGFDVSEHNKNEIEKTGVTFWSDLTKINIGCDVISLVHVLEHFKNPVRQLIQLKDFLKDEGLLLIQVPSYKINPFDLTIYDHGSFFCESTLTHTLIHAGFKVEQISTGIIPKEITIICKKSDYKPVFKNMTQQPLISQNNIKSSLQMLNSILHEALNRSKESPINIFGTSIGATWLTANLNRDKIRCYLDEDVSRVGYKFFDKDIVIPDSQSVRDSILPFPKEIADIIRARFNK